jgi:murein DD-endopeptidase MepM/ murein hydrolase activator NlpD
MKKVKYFYNTQTLRYEKLITPFRVKLLRLFGFLSGLLVASTVVIYLYLKFLPQPKQIESNRKYEVLQDNYRLLESKLRELQQQMSDLEKRDNEVYRSIFEANPVPDSTRVQLIEKKNKLEKIREMDEDELSQEVAGQLNQLSARIAFQFRSYENIKELIKGQDAKLASIPAIQPINNKQLTRIASGFGMRIDPVYGTPKMHKGLDFTAPQGTPIYATGDGVVKVAGSSNGGYGNYVIINHGYGYESLYGHMVRTKATVGQRVKRGEIIGWVGSTGKSTGPHCHYEVHINEAAVDPVHFFFNDLNADQYDQLLKLASTGSAKSFD